jgi:hypothetical protein
VPVCVLLALICANREDLPQWVRRLGFAAFLLLMCGLGFQLARSTLPSMPTVAWLVLAVAFPILTAGASGAAAAVFGLLALLTLGVLLARFVDLWWSAQTLGGTFYLLGLLALLPAMVMHKLRPPPPKPPEPAAAPPIAYDWDGDEASSAPPDRLIERLDSSDAQEGADKYTRE